ncbi:hypothetical protein HMPREF1981_02759 [Bacteroides pyogenes F0041]|uniref:Uncharacterized protein n=1 Tax=Bacteroides pyogenes F0041 TaxID=1321819 RepID=U2CD95_9BACE|nr:hypothetical protein HMPREF1981_02759 [Bacteroides pyogenes F0041]
MTDSFTPIYPESATIILDTTYFSKTFGLMLFQDAASGRIPDALKRVELG